jgi:hypothetical protein
MSEQKLTFADMIKHAKDELRRGAEENRTIESIVLEMPLSSLRTLKLLALSGAALNAIKRFSQCSAKPRTMNSSKLPLTLSQPLF